MMGMMFAFFIGSALGVWVGHRLMFEKIRDLPYEIRKDLFEPPRKKKP